MIAEQFARRRYKKGRKEGQRQTDKVWRDWYEKHVKTLNGVEAPPPPPDTE